MSLLGGGCWKGFQMVAEVTALHIICYVAAHPQPPKIMHYGFHCLPLSRVSSHQIIMVIFDDVKPELIVPVDVDLSSIEY